jgi:methylmalonyl-CoA mutase cobalamin-binding subunit
VKKIDYSNKNKKQTKKDKTMGPVNSKTESSPQQTVASVDAQVSVCSSYSGLQREDCKTQVDACQKNTGLTALECFGQWKHSGFEDH